jgi:formamidopyrimidine-DNA glycosylase
MPELPEVETVRRRLSSCLPDLVVDQVTVNDPSVSLQSEAALRGALRGRRVVALRRRGKYLIVELDGVLLVVHLRMTGRLVFAPEPGARAPRFVARFAPGADLYFYDTRRFGRVWAVEPAAEDEFFAALGPEPFSPRFSATYLRDSLRGRATPLKSFLLDQRRLAGVGNIYADEALFRAGLNPLRRAGTLAPGEAARLHDALLETLQAGIDHNGSSIDTFVGPEGDRGAFQEILNVYGRAGEPCRICGAAVRKVELGGRGTHFCPRCQPLPRGARLAAGGRDALARARAGRRRARPRDTERDDVGRPPGGSGVHGGHEAQGPPRMHVEKS